MKEAFVHEGPRVQIVDSPIPVPAAGQVLIRVHVAGSNPKDWKTYWSPKPMNQGNDMAGVIHSVGEGVTQFKPGDRVFAYHELQAPHGTHAEYAIAWEGTTAHIPDHISFEEAATIPATALTAAMALYRALALPEPWTPVSGGPSPEKALLIYGASSAVGAFAVKLARASNIHPIIAIAGAGLPFVKTLINPSKGDLALDYRDGEQAISEAINAAGYRPSHALDAISEGSTLALCARLLGQGAALAHVLPLPDDFPSDMGVSPVLVALGKVHGFLGEEPGAWLFGEVWMHALSRGLQKGGWLNGHPWEVVEGGLEGLQSGLERLKDGKVSAKKLLFRLVDE
ncbi:hypothetical protein VTO42DRAFT_7309 [Malbranchea cinnamomea]